MKNVQKLKTSILLLIFLSSTITASAQLLGGLPISNTKTPIIASIDCGGATNNGSLTHNSGASGVSSVIPYTGGNGRAHTGQVVGSSGVGGLTASLAAGTLASGNGSFTYQITGTPNSSGTANFAINIAGVSCTLSRAVAVEPPPPPPPSPDCYTNASETIKVGVPVNRTVYLYLVYTPATSLAAHTINVNGMVLFSPAQSFPNNTNGSLGTLGRAYSLTGTPTSTGNFGAILYGQGGCTAGMNITVIP